MIATLDREGGGMKRLEIRPPAAVRWVTLRKRRGRTGSAPHGSFSLFERVLKCGMNDSQTKNERQSNKNRNDSKPQKSRLFSALRGLKDGVHLSTFIIQRLVGMLKPTLLLPFPMIMMHRFYVVPGLLASL
jgi:hypothetical protein